MPNLIDKDNLLMDNSWAFYDENGNRNEACIAVENAPTVDAVEVVRCKDCIHREHDAIFNQSWCHGRRVREDYFCADGERKK